MESRRSEDTYKGYIRTKIEPDQKNKYGVLISVNDHYEIEMKENGIINSDEVLKIFESEWKASLEQSDKIIGYLMENL